MSDAVVDALRASGVPGDAAVDAGIAVPIGPDEYDDIVQAAIATDLDSIGLVAATHASPTARAAMLRTLLQQWRFENDDQLSIDVEVAVDDILSLLAPEAPTEDDDGR